MTEELPSNFLVEQAVLKSNMADVKKDIGDIKSSIGTLSKEFQGFILAANQNWLNKSSVQDEINIAVKPLNDKITALERLSTARLWQAGMLSAVLGIIATLAAQYIWLKVTGP
jgi:uncharacterized protein YoxC